MVISEHKFVLGGRDEGGVWGICQGDSISDAWPYLNWSLFVGLVRTTRGFLIVRQSVSYDEHQVCMECLIEVVTRFGTKFYCLFAMADCA